MSSTTRADLQLRPLSAVEVLDAAWTLVGDATVRMLAIVAPTSLLLLALTLGYYRWLGTLVTGTPDSVFWGGTFLWAMLMSAAWGLHSIARGALVSAVLAEARGGSLSLLQAWRRALAHALPLLCHGLFTGWLLWAATGCLVIPGVFAAAVWTAARPAILDDGRAYVGALARSQELTEGHLTRAGGILMAHVLLWVVLSINLYIGIGFLVGIVSGTLGVDLNQVTVRLNPRNLAYLASLAILAALLLDPLKTAAEAVLYLDIRVRRDGADLQQRLAGLRGVAVALALALCCLVAPRPAAAIPLADYQRQITELRARVEDQPRPDAATRAMVDRLRSETVDMPGGQRLDPELSWMADSLDRWTNAESGRDFAERLRGLEAAVGAPEPAPASGDPAAVAKSVLAGPRFQKLQERPEIHEIVGDLAAEQKKSFAQSLERFYHWLVETLLRPQGRPAGSRVSWDPELTRVVVQWLLIVLGAALLVMLLISVFRRWQERDAAPAALASAATVTLEAAAQEENALAHTVDEWETFARGFLERGDVRQAIRALYLATLVHLHRERWIDYNRTRTNWHYVRSFRGQSGGRRTLQGLTRMFDEAWYGGFPYGRGEYYEFERGARDLGTPAPAGEGPVHG